MATQLTPAEAAHVAAAMAPPASDTCPQCGGPIGEQPIYVVRDRRHVCTRCGVRHVADLFRRATGRRGIPRIGGAA